MRPRREEPFLLAEERLETHRMRYRLQVNGRVHTVETEPRRLLADVLRHELKLTGTHVGCEQGVCGACTVLVDGEPMRSCLLFAVQMEGHSITTIEGVASPEALHPLQEAFIEHFGFQCGFCTPGFILTAVALLQRNPDADEEEIREVLAANLCRCTGYRDIIRSVKAGAARMKELSADTVPRGGDDQRNDSP